MFVDEKRIVPPVARATAANVKAPEEPTFGFTKAMAEPKPTFKAPTLIAPAVPCRG